MARKIKKIEGANKRAKERIRNYNSEKKKISEKIQKCHMLTQLQVNKMENLFEQKIDNVVGEVLNRYLSENIIENDVLYTCQLVDNPKELMNKYPTKLPNKFYHHSTNKFGKQPFDDREGEKLRLHIIGRLTNDAVDALVVENPNSVNEIPHITLATAEGIKPFESNNQLKIHTNDIVSLDDYVETTFRNILNKNTKKSH